MYESKIIDHTPPPPISYNNGHRYIARFLPIFIFLLFTAGNLSALSGEFVGLGVETNGNARKGAAIGGSLSLGLDLNQQFSLGVKTVFSYDTKTLKTLEPAAFLRYYLPLSLRGFFIQAELGASFLFENGKQYPAFLGGLSFGWRYNIDKNWYIEPAVRAGYPFGWGVGIQAGFSFE